MSEVIQRNAAEVQEIAASMGLECFLPEPYELLIDDDEGLSQVEWSKSISRLTEVLSDNGIKVLNELVVSSKNGHKYRYTQLSCLVTKHERLVLQSLFGSDPVREVLSLIRLRAGSDAPTALFETKASAKKVRTWRANCTLERQAEESEDDGFDGIL